MDNFVRGIESGADHAREGLQRYYWYCLRVLWALLKLLFLFSVPAYAASFGIELLSIQSTVVRLCGVVLTIIGIAAAGVTAWYWSKRILRMLLHRTTTISRVEPSKGGVVTTMVYAMLLLGVLVVLGTARDHEWQTPLVKATHGALRFLDSAK